MRGRWSLCFQTSTEIGEVQARTARQMVSLFVPTTPNPTSGFVIMVPKEEVTELDMSVDEGLKMIISLGVVVPDWDPNKSNTAELRQLAVKTSEFDAVD